GGEHLHRRGPRGPARMQLARGEAAGHDRDLRLGGGLEQVRAGDRRDDVVRAVLGRGAEVRRIGHRADADVHPLTALLEQRRQLLEGAGGGQGQLHRADAGAGEGLEHGRVLIGALAADHDDQPGGGGALGKGGTGRGGHLGPPGSGGAECGPGCHETMPYCDPERRFRISQQSTRCACAGECRAGRGVPGGAPRPAATSRRRRPRAGVVRHNETMTSTHTTVESVLALLRRVPQSEVELEQLGLEAQTLPIGELVYLVEPRQAAEAALLCRVLGKEQALAVFEMLPASHQADLISALRTPQVAQLIGDLDPDDRASLFDELPASVAERLMHGLDADERAMTTAVLGYPRDAIGRYMSPEVLALSPGMSVRDALAHVREHGEDAETIYLLPVVDRSRVLLGVVGLRRLLGADEDALVGDLAHEAVRAFATEDREDAAPRFFAAKLLAMPIVDGEERL